MMQIGYDVTTLEGDMTGVGFYTARLLTHLLHRADGWTYELLSNCRTPHLPIDPISRTRRVHGPTGPFMPLRPFWLQAVLPLWLAQHDLDVCHFTNSLLPLAAPGRLIVTIHDMSLFLFAQYQRPRTQLVVRPFVGPSARRAQAVITVSQSARADIVRLLGIPAERVHVIYEAAAPHFRPLDDRNELHAVRMRYGLPEQFVLYTGTIEPRKNLVRVVEALAEVHRRGCPIPLVLVGQWGPRAYPELKATIEQLALTSHVRFLGYVPTTDLVALYNLATVFVFPSEYEGFGLPVVEAMACGLPVITADRSSLAEIVGRGGYLVDPYGVDEIAEAIACLLHSADLRADLRQRGLQRAAEFSWQRAAEQTAALYAHVAAG
jgi:glycosyltransferase involved in cell wall biosynthesis